MSMFAVESPLASTYVDAVVPPAKASSQIKSLFTCERFIDLTRYAEGVEQLKSALCELYHEYVFEVEKAINHNWNDHVLKSASAENAILLLYLNGTLDEVGYINAVIVVKAFQQFGLSESKTEHDIPCNSCEVIDLSLDENASDKDRILAISEWRESETTQKELDFAKVLKNAKQDGAFVLKVELSDVPINLERSANNEKLTSAIHQIEIYKDAPQGVVFWDEEANTLYIPLFDVMQEAINLEEFPIRPTPIFGTTSADDLAELRAKGKHPVILTNDSILNNFHDVHGRFASRLFPLLHDVQHTIYLSRIPDDWKTFLLYLDSVNQQIIKTRGNEEYDDVKVKLESFFTRISPFLQNNNVAGLGSQELSELLLTRLNSKEFLAFMESYQVERCLLDQDIEISDPKYMGAAVASLFERFCFQLGSELAQDELLLVCVYLDFLSNQNKESLEKFKQPFELYLKVKNHHIKLQMERYFVVDKHLKQAVEITEFELKLMSYLLEDIQ
ncbi:hypothetical protein D5018_05930 [Parashewanella curva]|uniref:Uncharacterized protein n=1 Tax=Parashewanella curva TaxID=2338552 RepID=A0A3L8Q1D3_9GAMM|nr:hypothetical protein [Parashewanella curva]RLV60638.1 hypothetical protein D5018_05930 [Parashewanella curva]